MSMSSDPAVRLTVTTASGGAPGAGGDPRLGPAARPAHSWPSTWKTCVVDVVRVRGRAGQRAGVLYHHPERTARYHSSTVSTGTVGSRGRSSRSRSSPAAETARRPAPRGGELMTTLGTGRGRRS